MPASHESVHHQRSSALIIQAASTGRRRIQKLIKVNQRGWQQRPFANGCLPAKKAGPTTSAMLRPSYARLIAYLRRFLISEPIQESVCFRILPRGIGGTSAKTALRVFTLYNTIYEACYYTQYRKTHLTFITTVRKQKERQGLDKSFFFALNSSCVDLLALRSCTCLLWIILNNKQIIGVLTCCYLTSLNNIP